MKSVCSQVLVKMKQVDVIIKEPMYRRASVDDFNLCFEQFSRKHANTQNLLLNSAFGLSLAGYNIFATNQDLRNHKNQKINVK